MTMPYQPAPRATQPGEPVGPIKAIGNFFRKGFQFSGRASRSEYWWIALYTFLFSGAQEYADSRGWPGRWAESTGTGLAPLLLLVVGLLLMLLLVVFSISLTVRRLHDANLSGWWCLLNLVPVLGSIALLVLAALSPDPRGVRFDNPDPRRAQNGTPA